MAELNDSFADNLQQKEERDVDISRGVDPFITGAIIALGGGGFYSRRVWIDFWKDGADAFVSSTSVQETFRFWKSPCI